MATTGEEEKKKTACVTGGNGYIAAALIKSSRNNGDSYGIKVGILFPLSKKNIAAALIKMLLDMGYAVRTTFRNPHDMEKNSHFKELQALGPLEVLRADLDQEGSFDDAVAGCDFAFLLAAPVNLTSENPEKDQIEPSLRGILNVMRSCVKAGTVKRAILTSSASSVCIRPLVGDGHVLDEESWSDLEYVTAEKPPAWGYVVSKVLSEKEASRFAQENGMSLVTLCPVLTIGASPVSKVFSSVPAALSMLSGDMAAFDMLKGIEQTFGGVPVVDLEDLCRAQVFVAETETASGRYICCSFHTTIVEIARFLAGKYPQYYNNDVLVNTDADLLQEPRVRLSSAKLVREGFEFKLNCLDGTYSGLVEYGKALGILPC